MTAIDRGASSLAIEPGLGPVLPGCHHRPGFLGRFDVEGQVDDAGVVLAVHGVPGVHEHPEHLGVLAEDLGGETADPAFPGCRGQVLQQDRTQPAALLRILHQEGRLGGVGVAGRVAVVGPGRDHLPAEHGDQPDPGVVVDIGEDLDLPVGDLVDRLEVPHVQRFLTQPAVHSADRLSVGRTRRAQVRDAAVSEQHVGLPLQRVPGRRCSRHKTPPGVWTRPDQSALTARPVMSPGSIAGVVGVQAVQRVDDRCGCPGWRGRRPVRGTRPNAGRSPGWARRRTCRPAAVSPGGPPRPAPANPAGSGVAGSRSWPETMASRCVHARGTTRTGEYPPPPNASHRPPVTVSASSRSASTTPAGRRRSGSGRTTGPPGGSPCRAG